MNILKKFGFHAVNVIAAFTGMIVAFHIFDLTLVN